MTKEQIELCSKSLEMATDLAREIANDVGFHAEKGFMGNELEELLDKGRHYKEIMDLIAKEQMK